MKEVAEETGIECVVERVLMVLDGMRLGFTTVPLYSIVFLCRAVGGELRRHELETTDVGFFARESLPVAAGRVRPLGRHVFRAIDGEIIEVVFDEPRPDAWRS